MIPEGFELFSENSAGTHLKGLVRTGHSGIWCVITALDSSAQKMLKNSRKISACITAGVFVKRFNMPGIWNQFRRYFKSGRPVNVLNAAAALKKANVNTPDVLAAFSGFRGMHRRDYLITEKIPADFIQMDRMSPQQMTARELWQRSLPGLLTEVGRMHSAGITHGDLNLRNIYSSAECDKFIFIDLDGTVCRDREANDPERTGELARVISSFCRYFGFTETEKLTAEAVKIYADCTGYVLKQDAVMSSVNYFIANHKRV